MVDYINKNESASYAELQWLFEEKGYDYKGELLSCSDVCEHVVFWSGWNAEAFDLMTELLHKGVVHREPAHPLRYLLDGPGLPFRRYSARCCIRRTIGRLWCS